MEANSFDNRFWSNVIVGGEDECWIWTGSLTKKGYGRIKKSGKFIMAHRHSARLRYGEIPSGLFACHTCDNPPCVNPSHLFLGTQLDNARDMAAKGRGAKHAGERNPSAKLTLRQVEEIRSSDMSNRALAKKYNVSPGSIINIKHNRTWVKTNG